MSKNKKVVAKAENKGPVKKPVKKATKPAPKKIAAKKPSKPANAKKANVKAAKPIKKALVKASKPKAASKVISKNTKPNKVVVKKTAPAKAAPKKVVSKNAPVKPVSKPSTSNTKPVSTPVSKKAEVSKEVKSSKVLIPPSPSVSRKENSAAAEKAVKKAEEAITKKQLAEKRSGEVLAITNTIPVKAKNEISMSKIASISHSITNPIKKTDSYAIKPEKEPNGKFELEFVVHSSAEMLYEFLSTPSGLSEWFCDDLNIRNGIYTFIWDDQLQQARLLKTVDLQLVRFQWVDKTDGSYFEFKIQRDDLTNDISLIITDFADSVSERESSKLLWHSQIEKLMHVIGSIF